MKVTVNLTPVSQCSAKQCAYNANSGCHARAITVGDGQQAQCDTYLINPQHVHNVRSMAGVGACKVTSCEHNLDFECAAPEIQVGSTGIEVRCLSFKMRAIA